MGQVHKLWYVDVSLHRFAYDIKLFAGIALACKIIKAQEELVRQTDFHEQFTKCLPIAGLAEKWTAEVTEWETDMSKPSPYVIVIERKYSGLRYVAGLTDM